MAGVLLDALGIQVDSLASPVVSDVLLFLLGSEGPTRVASGFLLDLEPGADVLGKEPRATLRFGKVPDFVERQNLLPLFHGLDEFGGAPSPAQGALVGGVGAAMTSLEERFWHLGLDALGAEGKGEFTPVTMGQHGMVESEGREDVHLGQSKVPRDVGVAWVGQDLTMPDGVGLRLVDPRVQRRHVQVLDPFPSGRVGLVMQFDGVDASAEKGVARLQGVHPVAGGQEGLERDVGLDLSVPVALPEDAEPVAAVPQRPVFLLGGVVHFLQGALGMEFGTLLTLLGETPRAPVPQTPVELVDGAGGGVVPVHEVLTQKALLSVVVRCADAVGLGGGRRGRRVDAKTMLLPRQPLQGFDGLIGPGSLPASTGFGHDGADGQEFFSPETVASGGDGDALDEGVELLLGLELFLECLATRLEQLDVRLAVGLHVAAQMDHDVVAHLLGVPPFELDLHFGGHAVGIVETRVGHGTLIVLVVHHVEKVREEPLAQFRESKRGGEGGEGKWQETERVLEGEAIVGEARDLGAHGDLIRDLSMHAVEMLEQKHAVVAFEVVEEDDDATVVPLAVDGQVVHRLDEPGRTILAVEENGVLGLGRLVADQDGRLHPLGVRDGFVVGKDQQRGFSLDLDVAVVVGFAHHGSRAADAAGTRWVLGKSSSGSTGWM